MTDLVVRRLLVDMKAPIARHWCDADAFRSAFFNALSMSFPVGEQFFIDAVRAGFKALPADQQERFKEEVQGFIGQEATHRRLHSLYNEHLAALGLVNEWGPRAQARMQALEGADVRHALGITAANEHFTAILAEWMLRNPQWLGSQDPRLATLWLWHSAEEAEHRCTAFDLYKALGGDEQWRLKWFRRVSLMFAKDVMSQTVSNLRRDGTLWKFSTWRSAASMLFGRQGFARQMFGAWKDYLRSDFHPAQHDAEASRRWLSDNQDRFVPVGG
ncbi:MAG: metal-dependent hydrolase [Burkholderiaceae bacterium]